MAGGFFSASRDSRCDDHRPVKSARQVKRIILSAVIFLLLMFPAYAFAIDAVTPSAFNVTPGHEQLKVHAPYTDDGNNDCTLTLSWGPSGTVWTDPSIVTVVLDHQDNVFTYLIKGLVNFNPYQVRVTFHDDDGVANSLDVQTVANIKPYNPLIHNSYTTGSLKWSAESGWGLPGSQYGEFSCNTCHARNTGNIKRIKKGIAVTDAGCADSFPIQGNGEVTFLNANKGSSHFGDDERIPASQSSNICEACHSKNKFHNYDAANNVATNHYNRDNCIGCHQHNAGFKASCGGCHPEVPDAASHDSHFNSAMLSQDFSCATCHVTSDHRNLLSEVRFDSDNPVVTGAIYVQAGGDETSCYTEASGYCPAPVYGTCNTLYCHSNADPLGGSNAYADPQWGASGMTCRSCHDPSGGAQAMSPPHGRHLDPLAYGYSCDKCHSATASGSETIINPDLHLNRVKDVSLAATGVYNSTTFACSSVYCHSDGRAGANTSPSCMAVAFSCHYADLDSNGSKETSLGDQSTSVAIIPDWAETGGYDCSACHKGRAGVAAKNAQMDSNAHFRLANEHWIRQYECSHCHNRTVDENGVLKFAERTHVNESVDIAFDDKWKIVGRANPSYNAATMVCENIYCHSDGTADPQIRDFPWDLGEHAKCDSCHGHETNDNCLACHAGGVPVVSAENQWKMATPMYVNTGPGTARANSHLRHLETEFACEKCHLDTVVGSCNTVGCHDGEIPSGQMSEVGHVFADYHVNKIKDVTFKDGGSYDPVTKTCSATDCHTGDDPVWGDSRNGEVLCLTCHGTTEADVDDYGAFNGVRARINMNEWTTSGHGRKLASGNYASGNPPADFPGNPCWYCHDNEILHDNVTNPYRLKEHPQFEKRFVKECVYCHMEQKDEECWGCHDDSESLSVNHQLSNLTGIDPDDGLPYTQDHAIYAGQNTTCLTSQCHLPQTEDQCRSCHDNAATGTGALQLDDALVRTKPGGKTYVIREIRVGMSAAPYAVDHLEFGSSGSKASVSCMATPQDWPPNGCHTADVHIHNTGAGTWTGDQKEDVRNQYVMMGVCLQCHDNDEDNRCNTCHVWSGAAEDNPYRLGYDPGTGFHTGSSKASSTHFGFKHFEDFENSQAIIDFTGTMSEAAKQDQKYVVTQITDASKAWVKDALVGKSLQLTSGPLSGMIRPILVNSGTTVSIKGYYPEAVPVNTTYSILGTIWKGGKFCWDCHDPHGDSNIYMVQKDISLTTDGLFGKPLERAPVSFTRTISGLDYAKNDAPYNGICNVCHTRVDHYLDDYGDAHRSGRRCTDCHEHGFGEGHGSGQGCNECHEQKPVPNHLGFGQPRDCTKCHDGVINQRTDILRQFRGQSHHVQGVEVTNKHCYQCHWEATEDGLINNEYHAGYNYKTHKTVIGGQNDMTVWDADGRPERYELGSTAIVFKTSSIGTVEERENVTNVTLHCLGCHSEQHNDTDVFGDCKTPRQYAWDRTSIAERYLDEGTTNWGKYSGIANAAQKIQTKAYSAHGKAVLNEGGWSVTDGEDGALANTRQGLQNVQCYDCHNSHGSYTSGITSSYKTFDNTYRGGNLKETQAGKGGYAVTYRAAAVAEGAGVVNPMNPGAAQCFDCHETRDAGAKPWGYFSTFGAQKPIQSYRDSARFGGGETGHKNRFPYRYGMPNQGGHLKASAPLNNAATQPINGLCSGCHDPHGVSPSLGEDKAYAVPLLKGTWLTSPYKEDQPQVTANQRSSSYVYLDRKTFGTTDGMSKGPSRTIAEDAEKFAGLCLRCHPKESLTDGINKNTSFKSSDRIHESVKGWGNNAEHNFSCSKCHNAHSSGLGRLMRTNCLNFTHRGQAASGGVPAAYSTASGMAYPRIAYYYGGANWWPACHESAGAGGGAWNQQEWNLVTPW